VKAFGSSEIEGKNPFLASLQRVIDAAVAVYNPKEIPLTMFFTWLATLNLLDVFNYYLILGFLASTAINFRRYQAMLGIMYRFPSRWPTLLVLMNKHRTIFFGWPTLLAIGLAFGLMLSNSLAIHLIWVHARLTFEQLEVHWLALAGVVLAGALMLFLDGRALWNAGRFDRSALEVNLDKAESWLKSWVAPAIRILTFGFVHPRKIVGVEVQRALAEANWTMIGGMRRLSFRTGVQFCVGLLLWLTWALTSQSALPAGLANH